jgi:hypothetical protein
MACRCVVHFRKGIQDKGNYKSFALRLIAAFNQDKTSAKIRLGSGGNFFIHYKGAAMPDEHADLITKLQGTLKNTHQADYHFYMSLPNSNELALSL